MLMAGQMRPPFSFWKRQKENAPRPVEEKKRIGGSVCASADLLPPAGDSWLSLAAVRNGTAMPLGKLPVRGGLGYILRRFSLPLARWLMDASATGR